MVCQSVISELLEKTITLMLHLISFILLSKEIGMGALGLETQVIGWEERKLSYTTERTQRDEGSMLYKYSLVDSRTSAIKTFATAS